MRFARSDRSLNFLIVIVFIDEQRAFIFQIIEAGHPLPDAAGAEAARRFLEAASALTKDDLLLFLVSGGASALLVEPAPGLALSEKQVISRALLKSGAPIDEMNCLRKHLSAIKGGRLAAAAHPAKVVTLGISDVPGDDPAVIGSGPTVGDPTTCADALAIAEVRGIDLPEDDRLLMQRIAGETVQDYQTADEAGEVTE